MNGILLIDKPKGITSRDVINQICKTLNTKKVGHTGTLDPLATGVMVVCIGKYTKLVEILTNYNKTYEAEIILGTLTDTLDITGNVIKEENVHLPFAEKDRMEECCQEYSNMLNSVTIDLQVLGIGANGHIGFNEPGTSFDQETFIVKLTEKTREDNKRFFNSIDEVPTHAITMGIKNIMNAKKIVLIATGKGKAQAIKALVDGKPDVNCPASSLQLHPDAVIIIDEEAASLLK